MTKGTLYNLLQEITPPFIFSRLKKTSFYKKGRSLARQHLSDGYTPAWHTITEGPLKGMKLYGDTKDPWQKDMLTGVYDDFFFKYVDSHQLEGKTIFDIGAHIGYSSLYF